MNKGKIVIYFLMIFGPLLILGGTIAVLLYTIQVRADRDILQSNESQNVRLQKKLISQQLHTIILDLLYLANQNHLQQMLGDIDGRQIVEGLTRVFLSFSRRKDIYDQVRFLNTSGMEVVRINFNDGSPSIVPPHALQSKKTRYYFETTLQLERSEVYISPFDLSIEQGSIEEPLKPAIRFGTPVFDSSGRKRGIIVLNYLGGKLLDIIDVASIHAFGDIMLLNPDGYWLYGPSPEKTWGFMYDKGKEHTLGNAFPRAWERIVRDKSGQFANTEGIFTFMTVYPLTGGETPDSLPKMLESAVSRIEPDTYYWKLVSYVSPAVQKARLHNFLLRFYIGSGLIILLFAVGSWFSALLLVKRKRGEEKIRQQHEFLESVLESLSHPFYVINADDYTVTMANSAAKRLYRPGNSSSCCYEYTHNRSIPCDGIEHICPLNKLKETKKPVTVEHIHYDKLGNARYVEVHAHPILDEEGDVSQVIEYALDITKRKRVEEKLAWEADVNAALTELSRALITTASIQDISQLVLEYAQRFTDSQFGFVGYIDPQTGYFVAPTLTREMWEPCQVSHKDIVFTTFTGLWGWVLKNGKPLLTNNAADDSRSSEIPQGHIPIHRFLSAPVMIREKVEGQVALANPNRDYTDRDLEIVIRLAGIYAFALRRKHSDEKVRQLSIAVEQSANTIVITDLEGKIIFANKAFERTTGYSREDAMGRSPNILKTDHLSHENYEELWNTISSAQVWHGEFFNKRKDGSTYWEEAVITPIKDELGEITSYLAVKEDITKRKTAEEDLKTAKEEAEAANRLKGEFLANMSHEIRTPMNAILGFTELLFDEERDPERRDKFQLVLRSGKHLLRLINDILDFSKIEADRIEINKGNFALRKLFTQIHRQYEGKVADQNLVFTMNLDDLIPRVVYGDEYRMYQIMANLVDNALKFTKEGKIVLDAHYLDGMMTIKVSDTGIGIPADKQHDIFSPFEQADASTSRQYGGTGLGLAISRRLAERMEGTIAVESETGAGSTFIFTLPLSVAVEEPFDGKTSLREVPFQQMTEIEGEEMVQRWIAGMRGDRELEGIVLEGIKRLPKKLQTLEEAVFCNIRKDIIFIAHSLKGASGNLGMTEIYTNTLEIEREMSRETYDIQHVQSLLNDLRSIISGIPEKYRKGPHLETSNNTSLASEFTVLAAEDNELNQMLLQELLRGMQVACDIAENGKIALDKLAQKRYDMLLLDMQMPVMDGLETIARIRSDTDLKDLYVIALTAHAMKGDAEKYIRAGCDDYLSKPIDKERFREKIQGLLFKKHASQNQEQLKESAESVHLEQSAMQLNQEQRQVLDGIVQELRKNRDIFHPDQIYALADTLGNLTSLKMFQDIRDKLYTIADRFDDQALDPIIEQLEVL